MRARVRIMVSWLPALSVTLIESSRYEPLATWLGLGLGLGLGVGLGLGLGLEPLATRMFGP